MGKGYLIDTNIVIYYLEGLLNENAREIIKDIFNDPIKISVITKIELLSWSPPNQSNLNILNSFIDTSMLIGLDDDVVTHTINLRKNYKKIKLPDAIIASTCIAHSLVLVTRNTSDFTGIDGLQIINPFIH